MNALNTLTARQTETSLTADCILLNTLTVYFGALHTAPHNASINAKLQQAAWPENSKSYDMIWYDRES